VSRLRVKHLTAAHIGCTVRVPDMERPFLELRIDEVWESVSWGKAMVVIRSGETEKCFPPHARCELVVAATHCGAFGQEEVA
jgi:hypothetical protein